jgi:hypothetical protein
MVQPGNRMRRDTYFMVLGAVLCASGFQMACQYGGYANFMIPASAEPIGTAATHETVIKEIESILIKKGFVRWPGIDGRWESGAEVSFYGHLQFLEEEGALKIRLRGRIPSDRKILKSIFKPIRKVLRRGYGEQVNIENQL